MNKEFRIGILTPHISGEYYANIIATIHKVIVQEKKAQMIAIQTEVNGYPQHTSFNDPVSLNHVDAWLVIANAASESTWKLLEQSGKPVVSIGYDQTSIRCHSVLTANRTGAKEAVLHLIDHGHRHIAFVGGLNLYDFRERYEGYKEALLERNIEYKEELAIKVNDSSLQEGQQAGEQLLENGERFTAVVAGTDTNALGVMKALHENGLTVPDDVAVVGFDDIEQAASHPIPLTTVRQPFSTWIRRASEILFDMLHGKEPQASLSKIPVELIRRSSCGCSIESNESVEDIRHYKDKISKLQASLDQARLGNDGLIQGLVRATSAEKIHLSNLFWGMCHWGCFALWETDPSGKRKVVIDQVFSTKGDPVPEIGERFDVESFPPLPYLPSSTRSGGSDLMMLYPIQSEGQDWGILALVGPMNRLPPFFANDLTRHSSAILAAVLERKSVFNQVCTSAERLEIVSKTTNDGIWDWDIVTNTIELNRRIHKVLGQAASTLADDPQSFLALVHEADRMRVMKAFKRHLEGSKQFQIEFRIKGPQNKYLWLYAAGEAIRDSLGKPIRMIGSFTDITEKKMDEERIKELAYHDSLTGLPNRLLFQDQLQQAMTHSNRNKGKLAVLIIDLDRFKAINDTLGHQSGDKLLQHVAHLLDKSIRDTDTIARIGGDEFIILLHPIGHIDEVKVATNRILERVKEPLLLEGREIFISASIGSCVYPDHGQDADTLIKNADMAMYKAKASGRNQMRVYTPDLSVEVEKQFNLENSLRKAIERNEFILYFQPQINPKTGEIYGIESLLRWKSPKNGLVPAEDFIPLAEETGLIVPIGTWILREACLQSRKWIDEGLPPLIMSVNISAQQFLASNFSTLLKTIMRETGVNPEQLCLEITESTFIDTEQSIHILKELTELGVQIAIDNFGTGHSSLMVLKRLPINMVKIDESFIRDMTQSQDNAAIVKAVITMSHGLGLSVTAEGVETEEQVHDLKDLHCDYIQGFYIGRPMPSEKLVAFMDAYDTARSSRT